MITKFNLSQTKLFLVKTVKQVEATRKTYHRDPTINTIHRASLLVPEIQNTTTEISFLNHY